MLSKEIKSVIVTTSEWCRLFLQVVNIFGPDVFIPSAMWIESMIGFMLLGGGQLALAEPHQALRKHVHNSVIPS